MRPIFFLGAAAAIALACPSVAAPAWSPVPGQITTPWTAKVSPSNPRPEYPRPQMVRAQWRSLNGLWQFGAARQGEPPPFGRDPGERILVPYPVESSLSGVGRHEERVWYRRTFDIPPSWSKRRVLLHFDAVDWESCVWVNRREMGLHRGGYDRFTLDITDAIQRPGPQELVLGVYDPMDEPGPNPRGKQIRVPKDIWFTANTGIWQTVWLEAVPQTHIVSLKSVPDVRGARLRLTVDAVNAPAGTTVRARVLDGSRIVARAVGKPGAEVAIPIPRAKLWSPERPFLYTLKVELARSKAVLDAVDSYFGMRSIDVRQDKRGIAQPFLNGRQVFMMGPLDQGYWPDGLHSAPTDDALRFDVATIKRYGFNMVRKHIKVEPERWYYWCDKLGLLVWQDMPNAFNFDRPQQQEFETELNRMVRGRWNHPSIVMWIVFNEGWGQYDRTRQVTESVKKIDPSRLVSNASGWNDHGAGDVVDGHQYPGPVMPKPEPGRISVCGEFGGIWCAVPGHQWRRPNQPPQAAGSFERVIQSYEDLMRRVYQMKAQGLAGAVYCEIADVESEMAGLMTYDRRVMKGDPERIAALNRGQFPSRTPLSMLSPTGETVSTLWRYATRKPVGDWVKPGYDDRSWSQSPTGFGQKGMPGSAARTEWTSNDIWLRRAFTLNGPLIGRAFLRISHDEDVEVYINGVLAYSDPGFVPGYVNAPLPTRGTAALRRGRNVIAVHCRQTEGGQFIDVGLGTL